MKKFLTIALVFVFISCTKQADIPVEDTSTPTIQQVAPTIDSLPLFIEFMEINVRKVVKDEESFVWQTPTTLLDTNRITNDSSIMYSYSSV